MIQSRLRTLFWDTDVEHFDPSAFPRYTISRVLEHGTEEDVVWLLRTFTREQIGEVLRTDHRLSPRSANFWALCFDVPCDVVVALR